MKEAGNIQNRSMEFVLFLTLPAAAALWVLSDEIIRVLYERGAFSQENTTVVAAILAIYGIGLPGFVMIKALQPGFYAREDTRTPMRFTGISVVIKLGGWRSRFFRSSPSAASRSPKRQPAGSTQCCFSPRCFGAAT